MLRSTDDVSTLFAPLSQYTTQDVVDSLSTLGPEYEGYAASFSKQDVDGRTLCALLDPSKPDAFSLALTDIGVDNAMHRIKLEIFFREVSKRVTEIPKIDGNDYTVTIERQLWLKACFILDICMKSARPFVGVIMQKFHERVMEEVKHAIEADLERCEDIDWDCSSFCQENDSKFTEIGPVILSIRSFDVNGSVKTSAPHFLKPGACQLCRLKNIPLDLFREEDVLSTNLSLYNRPNPVTPDDKKEKGEYSAAAATKKVSDDAEDSHALIILQQFTFDEALPILIPFRATRCFPAQPALQFAVVLCSSHPGYTKILVHSKMEAPKSRLPMTFAFWTMKPRGSEFEETKHSCKEGTVLSFESFDGSGLPQLGPRGSLYIVTDATPFSFRVRPMLCPKSSFTEESPTIGDDSFVLIRRSPVARVRDVAQLYHKNAEKAKICWPSIRASRLSSRHGEFCKMFCSQTSRDLDFFEESGTRSGEQLFNMIEMCTVFSTRCDVFRSLFHVEDHARENLISGLASLNQAIVGSLNSKGLQQRGIRNIRNQLAHDFLTLDMDSFVVLQVCAKQFLENMRVLYSCIGQENLDLEQALPEINRVVDRDMKISSFDDNDFSILISYIRKFDFFATCLRQDICHDLIETNKLGLDGAHGKVYKVRYWNQDLAVKIYTGTVEEKTWRRELGSLAFLSHHKNIVHLFYIVYDSVDDRHSARPPLGFAMELMAGSVAVSDSLSLGHQLRVFEQIANAVNFAHQNGVVHFDIKPENILVDESCTIAKLCDFSCAHKLHNFAKSTGISSLTGERRGTLEYMAPEVYHGDIGDFEKSKLCDVYSFGKTMWKLLHPNSQVDPLSECQVSAPVSDSLKELVEICTRKDPACRLQSMSEVHSRLQVICDEHQNQHEIPIKLSCFARASNKLDCFPGVRSYVKHRGFDLQELIVPLSTPCAQLRSEDMDQSTYWMKLNSDGRYRVDGLISSKYNVTLEPSRNTVSFVNVFKRIFNSWPKFFKYDFFVRLRVNDDIAAIFSEDGTTIYDCHGTPLFQTCLPPCQGQLDIFSIDNNFIWSSSIEINALCCLGNVVSVYGQPLNQIVADVEVETFKGVIYYTFSILNSSHVATDPRLMVMVFARMLFFSEYDSNNDEFTSLGFSFVLLCFWLFGITCSLPYCRKFLSRFCGLDYSCRPRKVEITEGNLWGFQ